VSKTPTGTPMRKKRDKEVFDRLTKTPNRGVRQYNLVVLPSNNDKFSETLRNDGNDIKRKHNNDEYLNLVEVNQIPSYMNSYCR